MTRGRRVPVLVDPEPPRTKGYQQALAADEAYFRKHPGAAFYERAYVPGEANPDMPHGTRVRVVRIGEYRRARLFAPPAGGEVRN